MGFYFRVRNTFDVIEALNVLVVFTFITSVTDSVKIFITKKSSAENFGENERKSATCKIPPVASPREPEGNS